MTLLLDVDGVIIRDKPLLDHVRNNVVRYVNKKLPGMKRHAKLNSLMYRAYGHTARGLEREFGVDVSDFDECVYTPEVIDHLKDFLKNDASFLNDAALLRGLNREIQLFSNAPLVWTLPVRDAIDPSIYAGLGTYSKPELDTYVSFDQTKKYIFVDDKMCNLMPALFFSNWTPIHFSKHRETQLVKTVGSIYELINVIS